MNKKENKPSAEVAEKEPKSTGSKVAFIIGLVLCIILVPILIVNCVLIVKNFTNPDKPPSLFGYTPMIVLTDSMDPLIAEGDIILSKTVDPDSVEVGDVISFFDPSSPDDAILTHRVIDIYTEDGVRYAVTAGDNNANRDYKRDYNNAAYADDPDTAKEEVAAKVTKKDDPNKPGYKYVIYGEHKDSKPVELTNKEIIGSYAYKRIPLIGKVSMFMQTTWGWVICIAVPLLAFLAYELISRKKKDKSKEKDMDALLAELEALKAAKAAAEGAEAPVEAPADASANDGADDTQNDSSKEE